MSTKEGPETEYTWLSGNCGLKVSKLCYGTVTFGARGIYQRPGQSDEEISHVLLNRFAELGGNFIDTANCYSDGLSESFIGSWLEKQPDREKFVIATKVRLAMNAAGTMNFSGKNTYFPNRIGLSRQAIMQNVEDSLRRLRTDYIDLYQIHSPDPGVPMEETLHTMNDLIRAGKIRYFGGSNLLGYELQKYMDRAKYMGLSAKMATLQQQYSLLVRESEWECFEVCREEGVGVLPWSPLKGGLLSGKFKKDQALDTNTRVGWATANSIKWISAPNFKEYKDDQRFQRIMTALEEVAILKDKTVAQVALRWVSQRPCVTSVVGGATTLKQLDSNMAALSDTWYLSDAEMARLNEASAVPVPYPYNSPNRMERIRVLGQFVIPKL